MYVCVCVCVSDLLDALRFCACVLQKPKAKNPLDELPKSTFVLDEWKRTYSNLDTEKEAIPWLWKNFDPAGYSIWFADYKYNDENTVLFMTCNLVGGFVQRLERLRKYAFGSLLICGNEKPFEITGLWIFRGQDIPAEMKECDDSEHYSFRRADPEKDRDLINVYLMWEGDIPGKKPINQGKIFK